MVLGRLLFVLSSLFFVLSDVAVSGSCVLLKSHRSDDATSLCLVRVLNFQDSLYK
jgi:hypothetical protein